MKFNFHLSRLKSSLIFTNSIWGFGSSVIQNLFLSVFFILVARNYSVFDFSQFIIATNLYQIFAAFSTLGLGQWFIREYFLISDKNNFVNKFAKIQFYSGFVFYLINVGIAVLLYEGDLIRLLALVLGVNTIIDNIIFSVKNLNIAEFKQNRTFVVLAVDAFLRFLIGASLLIFPFSILTTSFLIIAVRVITLSLFLNIGNKDLLNVKSFYKVQVPWNELKKIIFGNWHFIVIGSVSIVYWRIASIIISKVLTDTDVANYEISFKIFLLAQLVPLILSSTVFPTLVKLYSQPDKTNFYSFYNRFYFFYFLFGLFSYAFIYSFANYLVPLAFGNSYSSATVFTKQIFLVMLVFPTFFLQANVLIAMKLEKLDMILNLIGIASYLLIAFLWLSQVKSLSVINYSIFISFILLHILQDVILIRKGVTNPITVVSFLLAIGIFIPAYSFLYTRMNEITLFLSFSLSLLILLYFKIKPRTIRSRIKVIRSDFCD